MSRTGTKSMFSMDGEQTTSLVSTANYVGLQAYRLETLVTQRATLEHKMDGLHLIKVAKKFSSVALCRNFTMPF